MARKTMAELKAEYDEALRLSQREVTIGLETIAQMQASAQARTTALKEKDAAIDELKGEINSLRDQLFDAEIELSRRAGYLQAVEDAAPAPMIEAPRARQALDRRPRVDDLFLDRTVYGQQCARRWYHK